MADAQSHIDITAQAHTEKAQKEIYDLAQSVYNLAQIKPNVAQNFFSPQEINQLGTRLGQAFAGGFEQGIRQISRDLDRMQQKAERIRRGGPNAPRLLGWNKNIAEENLRNEIYKMASGSGEDSGQKPAERAQILRSARRYADGGRLNFMLLPGQQGADAQAFISRPNIAETYKTELKRSTRDVYKGGDDLGKGFDKSITDLLGEKYQGAGTLFSMYSNTPDENYETLRGRVFMNRKATAIMNADAIRAGLEKTRAALSDPAQILGLDTWIKEVDGIIKSGKPFDDSAFDGLMSRVRALGDGDDNPVLQYAKTLVKDTKTVEDAVKGLMNLRDTSDERSVNAAARALVKSMDDVPEQMNRFSKNMIQDMKGMVPDDLLKRLRSQVNAADGDPQKVRAAWTEFNNDIQKMNGAIDANVQAMVQNTTDIITATDVDKITFKATGAQQMGLMMENLSDAVNRFSRLRQDLGDEFSEMGDNLRRGLRATGNDLRELGSELGRVGTLAMSATKQKGAQALQGATNMASRALQQFGAGMQTVYETMDAYTGISRILPAIRQMGGLSGMLRTGFDRVRSATQTLLAAMKGMSNAPPSTADLMQTIRQVPSAMQAFATKLGSWLKGIMGSLKNSRFGAVGSAMANPQMGFVSPQFQMINGVIQKIIGGFRNLQNAGRGALNQLTPSFQILQRIAQRFGSGLSALGSLGKLALSGLATGALSLVRALGQVVTQGQGLRGVVKTIDQLGAAVRSVVASKLKNVFSAENFGKMAGGLQQAAQAMRSLMQNIGQFRNQLNQSLNTAKQMSTTMFTSMSSGFKTLGSVVDRVGKQFQTFGDRVRNGFQNASQSAATLYFLSSTMTQAGSKLTGIGRQGLQQANQLFNQYSGYEMAVNRAAVSVGDAGDSSRYPTSTAFEDVQNLVFGMQRGTFGGTPVYASAEEIAQAAYYYQSAVGGNQLRGEMAQTITASLLGPILQMSQATQTDPEQYIKGVVQIAQEFGMQPGQSPQDAEYLGTIANLVGYVANISTLEVPDILETFKYLGPQANMLAGGDKKAGLADAMVMTYLASMSGMKGSMAGRGMSQIVASILDLSDPSSTKADEVANTLGLQYGGEKTASDAVREFFFNEDNTLKGGITGALNSIIQQSGGNPQDIAAVLNAMFPQNATRVGGAIAVQMTKDENFTEAIKALAAGDFDAANDLFARAVASTSDTVTASFQYMKNAWFQLQVSIVDAVKGPIKEALQFFGQIFFQLSDVMKSNPFWSQLVTGIGAVVTAVAGVLGSLLTMGGTLFMIQRSFIMAGGSVSLFLGIITTLFGSLFTLLPIFLLIGVVVSALVGHFKDSGESITEFITRLQGNWGEGMGKKLFEFTEKLKAGLTEAAMGFYEFVNVILLGKSKVQGGMQGLANAMDPMNVLFSKTAKMGEVMNLALIFERMFGARTAAGLTGILMYASQQMDRFRDSVTGGADSISERVKKLRNVGAVLQGIVQAFATGSLDWDIKAKSDIFGEALGIENFSDTVMSIGEGIWKAFGIIVGYAQYFKEQFSLVFDEIAMNMSVAFGATTTAGQMANEMFARLNGNATLMTTTIRGASQELSLAAFIFGFIRGVIIGVVGVFMLAAQAVAAFTRRLAAMRTQGKTISDTTKQVTGLSLSIQQLGAVVGVVFGGLLGAKLLMSLRPVGQLIIGMGRIAAVAGQVAASVGKMVVQFAIMAVQVALNTAMLLAQVAVWGVVQAVTMLAFAAKMAFAAATTLSTAASAGNTAASMGQAAANQALATALTNATTASVALAIATGTLTLKKFMAMQAGVAAAMASMQQAGADSAQVSVKAALVAITQALIAVTLVLVAIYFFAVVAIMAMVAGIVILLAHLYGLGAAFNGIKAFFSGFMAAARQIASMAKAVLEWALGFMNIGNSAQSLQDKLRSLGTALGYLIGLPILGIFTALVGVFALVARGVDALQQKMSDMGISFSDIGQKVMSGFQAILPFLQGLWDFIKGFAIGFGIAIIGTIMLILAILKPFFSFVSSMLKKMQVDWQQIGKIIGVVAAVFLAVFVGPFIVSALQIIAIIGLVVAAAVLLVEGFQKLADWWNDGTLLKAVGWVMDMMYMIIMQTLGQLVNMNNEIFRGLMEGIAWAMEQVADLIGKFAGPVEGFFSKIGIDLDVDGWAAGIRSAAEEMRNFGGAVDETWDDIMNWKPSSLLPPPPEQQPKKEETTTKTTTEPTKLKMMKGQVEVEWPDAVEGVDDKAYILNQDEEYYQEQNAPARVYRTVTDAEGNESLQQTEYYRYQGQLVTKNKSGEYVKVDEKTLEATDEVVYEGPNDAAARARERRAEARARVQAAKEEGSGNDFIAGIMGWAQDQIAKIVGDNKFVAGFFDLVGLDGASMTDARAAGTVISPEEIQAMREATKGTQLEDNKQLDMALRGQEQMANEYERLWLEQQQLMDDYAAGKIGDGQYERRMAELDAQMEKTKVSAESMATAIDAATAAEERRLETVKGFQESLQNWKPPSFEDYMRGSMARQTFAINTIVEQTIENADKVNEAMEGSPFMYRDAYTNEWKSREYTTEEMMMAGGLPEVPAGMAVDEFLMSDDPAAVKWREEQIYQGNDPLKVAQAIGGDNRFMANQGLYQGTIGLMGTTMTQDELIALNRSGIDYRDMSSYFAAQSALGRDVDVGDYLIESGRKYQNAAGEWVDITAQNIDEAIAYYDKLDGAIDGTFNRDMFQTSDMEELNDFLFDETGNAIGMTAAALEEYPAVVNTALGKAVVVTEQQYADMNATQKAMLAQQGIQIITATGEQARLYQGGAAAIASAYEQELKTQFGDIDGDGIIDAYVIDELTGQKIDLQVDLYAAWAGEDMKLSFDEYLAAQGYTEAEIAGMDRETKRVYEQEYAQLNPLFEQWVAAQEAMNKALVDAHEEGGKKAAEAVTESATETGKAIADAFIDGIMQLKFDPTKGWQVRTNKVVEGQKDENGNIVSPGLGGFVDYGQYEDTEESAWSWKNGVWYYNGQAVNETVKAQIEAQVRVVSPDNELEFDAEGNVIAIDGEVIPQPSSVQIIYAPEGELSVVSMGSDGYVSTIGKTNVAGAKIAVAVGAKGGGGAAIYVPNPSGGGEFYFPDGSIVHVQSAAVQMGVKGQVGFQATSITVNGVTHDLDPEQTTVLDVGQWGTAGMALVSGGIYIGGEGPFNISELAALTGSGTITFNSLGGIAGLSYDAATDTWKLNGTAVLPLGVTPPANADLLATLATAQATMAQAVKEAPVTIPVGLTVENLTPEQLTAIGEFVWNVGDALGNGWFADPVTIDVTATFTGFETIPSKEKLDQLTAFIAAFQNVDELWQGAGRKNSSGDVKTAATGWQDLVIVISKLDLTPLENINLTALDNLVKLGQFIAGFANVEPGTLSTLRDLTIKITISYQEGSTENVDPLVMRDNLKAVTEALADVQGGSYSLAISFSENFTEVSTTLGTLLDIIENALSVLGGTAGLTDGDGYFELMFKVGLEIIDSEKWDATAQAISTLKTDVTTLQGQTYTITINAEGTFFRLTQGQTLEELTGYYNALSSFFASFELFSKEWDSTAAEDVENITIGLSFKYNTNGSSPEELKAKLDIINPSLATYAQAVDLIGTGALTISINVTEGTSELAGAAGTAVGALDWFQTKLETIVNGTNTEGWKVSVVVQNSAAIAAINEITAALEELASLEINITVTASMSGKADTPEDRPGQTGPHAAGGIVDTPFQMVGELGRELVSLPMGSRVFSASQTENILSEALSPSVNMMTMPLTMPSSISVETDGPNAAGANRNTQQVSVVFNGDMNIRSDDDISKLVDEIDRELGRRNQNAKRGMGSTSKFATLDS